MDAQGGMEAQSVHGHDDGGLTGLGGDAWWLL